MNTLTRDDAEVKYTRWIMENGNLQFFVSQYLQRLDNNELAEDCVYKQDSEEWDDWMEGYKQASIDKILGD